MLLDTPVAFIIFNRADTAAQVFAEIRKAQPRKLFVIADGPRTPEEADKCRATRAVIDGVDWDCEVYKNYSEVNLGCGRRPSSGISWVFEQVEEAIILEDDCLPDPSFFPFCEQMLQEHRDDDRVMHIGGTNVTPDDTLAESYVFTRLTSIWGWATWRRAWQHYDYVMKAWPEYKATDDLNYYRSQKSKVSQTFEDQWKSQGTDVWDAQWWFTCASRQGFGILPKVNLIQNIGFRPDATHTPEPNKMSQVPVGSLQFPLAAPSNVSANAKYDEDFLEYCWGPPPTASNKALGLLRTLKSKVKIRSRMQSIAQTVKRPNSAS